MNVKKKCRQNKIAKEMEWGPPMFIPGPLGLAEEDSSRRRWHREKTEAGEDSSGRRWHREKTASGEDGSKIRRQWEKTALGIDGSGRRQLGAIFSTTSAP